MKSPYQKTVCTYIDIAIYEKIQNIKKMISEYGEEFVVPEVTIAGIVRSALKMYIENFEKSKFNKTEVGKQCTTNQTGETTKIL